MWVQFAKLYCSLHEVHYSHPPAISPRTYSEVIYAMRAVRFSSERWTQPNVEVSPTLDSHSNVEVNPTLDPTLKSAQRWTHSNIEVNPTLDSTQRWTQTKVEINPTLDSTQRWTHSNVEVKTQR